MFRRFTCTKIEHRFGHLPTPYRVKADTIIIFYLYTLYKNFIWCPNRLNCSIDHKKKKKYANRQI